MIVVDANIVVSAIAGRHTRAQLERVVAGGADIAIPAPQVAEALKVLIEKMDHAPESARTMITKLQEIVRLLEPATYAQAEQDARARLHERGQRDWPVLAAALAFGGAVWSNDRDFFGVGVPVWSTRNVHLAGSPPP